MIVLIIISSIGINIFFFTGERWDVYRDLIHFYYYYLSIEEKTLANFYKLRITLYQFVLYAPVFLILILYTIQKHLEIKKEFQTNDQIIHLHKGYTYFYMMGLLIIFFLLMIASYIFYPYRVLSVLPIYKLVLFFGLIYLLRVLSNRLYNDVNYAIKAIRNQIIDEHTYQQKQIKKLKITSIFYVVMVLAFVSTFSAIKVAQRHAIYPEQLVLTPESKFNTSSLPSCFTFGFNYYIACGNYVELMQYYQIDKIEVILPNAAIEALQSGDYFINLRLDGQFHSIDTYTLEPLEDSYLLTIELKDLPQHNPVDVSFSLEENKPTRQEVHYVEFKFYYVKR